MSEGTQLLDMGESSTQSCIQVMESPSQSPSQPHAPQSPRLTADTPLFLSSPLKISLSFKNGQTKTLERFLTARIRFETPDAERAELYKVFQHFDTDGDGNLSAEEIRDSLNKLGILVSAADIASLLPLYEEDHGHNHVGKDDEVPSPSGYVDFARFYQLYRSLCQEENEEGFVCTPNGKVRDADLRSAFDLFDINHDGFISANELQSMLLSLGFKEGVDQNDCKSMVTSVDSDGDGMVNFVEFRAMMKNMKEY